MTFLGGNSGGIPSVPAVAGSGTQNAPGAGVSFAGVAPNPPAGIYSLWAWYGISGAVETQPLNVALVLNNATFVTLPSSMGINALCPVYIPRWVHTGTTTPFLKAVAAATAATVYSGSIIVVQLDA